MTCQRSFLVSWLIFFGVQCKAALPANMGVVSWGMLKQHNSTRLANNVSTIFSNSYAFVALKTGGEAVTWCDYEGGIQADESKLSSNVSTIFPNSWAFAALKTGGEVVTWGDPDSGGDSSSVASKLSGNVTTVFSSEATFAALKLGGEVVTWGIPDAGGDSSSVASKLSSNVTNIFIIPNAVAAVKTGGEVVTWGVPDAGGDSSAVASKLKSNVTNIFSNLVFFAERKALFAALKTSGEVVTWGDAQAGGNSSSVASKLSMNVTNIFINARAVAALKTGGEVVTWGVPDAGGDSSSVASKLSSNVTIIFYNYLAFAALTTGGEVVTWGHAKTGGDSSSVASKLSNGVTTIFSNHVAFAALTAVGEVVTWGDASSGGNSSFVAFRLRSNVTTIFTIEHAFAALKVGGEVVTWGDAKYGGDSSAVASRLSSGVTAIFGNGGAFVALKGHGEAVSWGHKSAGGDSSEVASKITNRVQAVFGIYGGRNVYEAFAALDYSPGAFAALVCIPDPHETSIESGCPACSPETIWKDMQCQECQELWEVPNDKQSKCVSCGAGSSPNLTHRSECVACPGNTYAAEGSIQCQPCPDGLVVDDIKETCMICPRGRVPVGSDCLPCSFMRMPDAGRSECVIDFYKFTVYLAYVFALGSFVSLLAIKFHTQRKVIDVSLHDGSLLLTTQTPHNLRNRFSRKSFPIILHDTCHPDLDASNSRAPQVCRATVTRADELELLDADGNSIDKSLDTSRGRVSLTVLDLCLHMCWPIKQIPLFLPVVMLFFTGLILALFKLKAVEVGILTPSTVLVSGCVSAFFRRRSLNKRTPLENKLVQFTKFLRTVNSPKPCEKGAGRGIRLNKLLQTRNFFRAFIQDRTAYYLDGNILKPLCAKHKLSYAEVVGPQQADYFVSHFWGTPFQHFCDSLEKHAQSINNPASSSSGSSGQQLWPSLASGLSRVTPQPKYLTAYWICFCSNNQYDIVNELGAADGWQQSSFYLTLRSPSVKSVCMILDDKALPLRRSWCIFETLQALKLSKVRDDFELLMCTASGVLNYGNGSIEAAMGVVHEVSRLDLKDAQATCQSDKEMIDDLVIKEMGSYSALNAFLRENIYRILMKAKEHFTADFAKLEHVLHAGPGKTVLLKQVVLI